MLISIAIVGETTPEATRSSKYTATAAIVREYALYTLLTSPFTSVHICCLQRGGLHNRPTFAAATGAAANVALTMCRCMCKFRHKYFFRSGNRSYDRSFKTLQLQTWHTVTIQFAPRHLHSSINPPLHPCIQARHHNGCDYCELLDERPWSEPGGSDQPAQGAGQRVPQALDDSHRGRAKQHQVSVLRIDCDQLSAAYSLV